MKAEKYQLVLLHEGGNFIIWKFKMIVILVLIVSYITVYHSIKRCNSRSLYGLLKRREGAVIFC